MSTPEAPRPNLPGGKKAAVIGVAALGGALLAPEVARTQGYADVSARAKSARKAALADLRPAKSVLVRTKGATLNPLQADAKKLASGLAQAKSALEKAAAPATSALSRNATAAGKNLTAARQAAAGARSTAKKDVAAHLAPVKSALIRNPALKALEQDRKLLEGDLANAKKAVKASPLAAAAGRVKGQAGKQASALEQVAGNAKKQARADLRPAKSVLVRDKTALTKAVDPARKAIGQDLGAARKAVGQARKDAGAEVVGKLKKRPRIWNVVKPAGSP